MGAGVILQTSYSNLLIGVGVSHSYFMCISQFAAVKCDAKPKALHEHLNMANDNRYEHEARQRKM